MSRSAWAGHPLTLVAAGAVALAAGAAAAITSRTRITGRARRVAAIRVGDTVAAQIDETGSPTVLAIQDPVSVP